MDSTTWFIIWVVLSVLVGMWNQNRGNSFWMGLVLAVLLSPVIGGIVVAVTKPNKEALEKKELASGKMKKCHACAELIRADATKCRHCGSVV
jgi:TctA family transporter